MQWTQSNGNDANEMSARKGPLVEVVAEGDHLYVACVREPVPHLETPVLPRCKPPIPTNSRARVFRDNGAEVGEVAPAGSGMACSELLLSYCCGERYTADSSS
jgi:hypothetical protein